MCGHRALRITASFSKLSLSGHCGNPTPCLCITAWNPYVGHHQLVHGFKVCTSATLLNSFAFLTAKRGDEEASSPALCISTHKVVQMRSPKESPCPCGPSQVRLPWTPSIWLPYLWGAVILSVAFQMKMFSRRSQDVQTDLSESLVLSHCLCVFSLFKSSDNLLYNTLPVWNLSLRKFNPLA